METIGIIELIIAAILFVTMLIVIFNKRIKKAKIPIIIILILIQLGLIAHVWHSYYGVEPLLELNGSHEVTIQAKEQYNEEGIKGLYHKKDISKEVSIIGNVNVNIPGTYVITYKYTYGYKKDKVKEVNRIVNVEDKESPVITLKGNKEITLYTDETYKEPGYTAEDNVDNNLTKQVRIDKKKVNNTEYQLVYSVADSSNNKASVTRTIKLKKREVKTEKPVSNKNVGQVSGNKGTTSGKLNNLGGSTSSGSSGQTSTGANSGVIYLTFDDGPSQDITPKILDILKEENVKATFFILNYNSAGEKLVKREAAEGHSIGIHGYSHDYKKIYQSVDTYMNNVTKLQDKIRKSTGITTYITRFPGGSSNTVSSFNPKIMTKLTNEVVNRGFSYFDWNVSSGDAGGAKNKDKVYKNVTKNLMKNRSNVVLMHDFSGNNKTLNALRAIIGYGKQHGYTFRAITKDTPMVTHPVNN